MIILLVAKSSGRYCVEARLYGLNVKDSLLVDINQKFFLLISQPINCENMQNMLNIMIKNLVKVGRISVKIWFWFNQIHIKSSVSSSGSTEFYFWNFVFGSGLNEFRLENFISDSGLTKIKFENSVSGSGLAKRSFVFSLSQRIDRKSKKNSATLAWPFGRDKCSKKVWVNLVPHRADMVKRFSMCLLLANKCLNMMATNPMIISINTARLNVMSKRKEKRGKKAYIWHNTTVDR